MTNNKFIIVKILSMFQKVIKIIDLYYINLLLLLSQKDVLNRKQNKLYDTRDFWKEKKIFSYH